MKVSKLLLSSTLLFGMIISVVSPVSAAQENNAPTLDVNYDNSLGHEGRTKDQIIAELRSDGLSKDDADFYAKLDIMVTELERRGIEISPPSNAVEYSDEYYQANKREIRDEALNLDRSALMTIFKKNKAHDDGQKDIEKTFEALKSKLEKGKEFKYTINYPDGSSAIYSGVTINTEPDSSEVVTNTELSGPWNSDGDAFYIENNDTFGRHTTTTDWRFITGASYAKVGDTLEWGITKNKGSLTYYSDTGASSYAGVVMVDKEYLSNHKTGSVDGDYVLQGYTDVVFKVSGSFSAKAWGIGISVNAGAGWHQYCISEIINFGDGSAWGAYGYPATYF